jgi:alkanesulfonate monooxygenase SsuD/methylene tetrahydromethanopterin reductase-like flavin-dependent oxidoreductase (luciferase family)
MLAVAASRTERIGLGTSIVPVYPRHPIVLVAQTLVIADLAPGRFRLGIGSSHRPTIEGMFGLPFPSPLRYVREYLAVLRQLLWEGKADFEGEFFSVHAPLPAGMAPPRIPLLTSALRANAFRQAGEIADGAISWVCPVHYLVETAMPALQAGAESAGRPVPPLIAHVPVAPGGDRAASRQAGREFLNRYAQLPFYAAMFADAGYPVQQDGTVPNALVDEMVVTGSGEEMVQQLKEILQAGMSEILVTLLPAAEAERNEQELMAALRAVET